MNNNPFSTAVLMCHAPIVIPGFDKSREKLCENTTRAMQDAAAHIVRQNLDAVMLLSPHAPRYRTAFGISEGPTIEGDFSAFGRPDYKIKFNSNMEAQKLIEQVAKRENIAMQPIPAHNSDHGAMVPLHFLQQFGFTGDVVVIGFPAQSSTSANKTMGNILSKSAQISGKRWGIIASGDMSHRLTPGAPAGFHPQAERFDRLVTKCIETGEYANLSALENNLREVAGEDVLDSLEIACAALENRSDNHKLLSYEGPFGVGYLVAILQNAEHHP